MPDTRPPLHHLVLKAAARLRARGPAELARLAATRAAEWLSSDDTLIFLVRDAGGDPPAVDGLTLREAALADGPAYARDIGTDSARTFAARLSERTRCFVVEREARLVHATWMTTKAAWTRELRAYVHPPEPDAYVYESYTRPEIRGRGVYPFALAHIAGRLGAAGIERVWVGIEADNPASLRAVTKAGFEEAFRIDYRRRAGRLVVDSVTGDARAARFLSRSAIHPSATPRWMRAGDGALEQGKP